MVEGAQRVRYPQALCRSVKKSSHMLPKLSCLSNQHCQSANLAPRAIEEWDNESLILCVPLCGIHACTLCAQGILHQCKYERIYCFPVLGELGMAPFLHRGDEQIFSSMTEIIVLSYLNCQHRGEPAAADYQAVLTDSPWGLCLQHCLAFKHKCICQVLSSVLSSNSYRQQPH